MDETLQKPLIDILRIDFSVQVTVVVGTAKKEFFAHKDILTKSSEFFQKALEGTWRESRSKRVYLPDQPDTAFSIYLNWLYGGGIDLFGSGETPEIYIDESGVQREHSGDQYKNLIQSYVLGNFLADDVFCNDLINAYFDLRSATKTRPKTEHCNIAFEELPANSNLRLLLVHHVAFSVNYGCLSNDIKEFHPEMVQEVALASVQGRRKEKQKPWDRGRCFYHIHKDGDKKCD